MTPGTPKMIWNKLVYVVSVAWFQLIILHYIYIYDYVVLSPKHQMNNFLLFIPGCSRCHTMFPRFDVLSIRDLDSAVSPPRLQAQQIQLLFQLHFVEDWRRSYQGLRPLRCLFFFGQGPGFIFRLGKWMDMEDAGGTRLARVTRDPQIFLCNYLNGVWPQLDINRAFPMKKIPWNFSLQSRSLSSERSHWVWLGGNDAMGASWEASKLEVFPLPTLNGSCNGPYQWP